MTHPTSPIHQNFSQCNRRSQHLASRPVGTDCGRWLSFRYWRAYLRNGDLLPRHLVCSGPLCAIKCLPVHCHTAKHILKYLYLTKDNSLYYWRSTPNNSLPQVDLPRINSTSHDLLMDGQPLHNAMDLHSYVDSNWASCPKTRRSFTGICIRLAGGTIVYKSKIQPTVAQSPTEAEFMGASDFGQLLLFLQSVL